MAIDSPKPTTSFAKVSFALTLCVTFSAWPAQAGDGLIEINQTRAIAGGITSADTPGFPVSLVGNSSYILTSDLDAGALSGISINGPVNNITIDFNGFALRGNAVGTAIGINSTAGNIEIKDGTVTAFGGRGILLQSSGRQIVRNMRVIENGDIGVDSNGALMITDCFIQSNGGDGIEAGGSSYIARNRIFGSEGSGIDGASGSFVVDNLITTTNASLPAVDLPTNTGSSASGYRNNVIGNGGAGGTVVGGIDMGGNLCNGSTSCP